MKFGAIISIKLYIKYNLITSLSNDLDNVRTDLGEQSPIWVDDYAIQSTSGSPIAAEGHSYATFSVTEGCLVKGYTRGGAGASRGCAFYDADGGYISGEYNSISGVYDWNYEIAVPDGARIFRITCNTSYKESFTFTLSNIANGLLKARTQIDTNTNTLSKVFSNYSKINIIEGLLYTSISSTSVGSESVAKNQISFYFPVETDKTYTVDKKITTALMRIAYSESKPTYLTPVSNYENLGSTGTYKTFTAPVDGYAIIYVYNRSNDGDDKFEPILYNTVAYEYAYVPEVAQDSVELTSIINHPHIFYCGNNRKYKKLKDAIEAAEQYMGSVLYVNAGVYDLVDEFGTEFFENLTASSTLSGIVLKNRIHIIFSPNSKVVAITQAQTSTLYLCIAHLTQGLTVLHWKILLLNAHDADTRFMMKGMVMLNSTSLSILIVQCSSTIVTTPSGLPDTVSVVV